MAKTIADLDLKGKRVLVRVDFNVPLDEAGGVADDHPDPGTSISSGVPTSSTVHGRSVLPWGRATV